MKFKSKLGEIRKGNSKKRSKEQKHSMYNMEMLYKARNENIKCYDDHSSLVSEAKSKAKQHETEQRAAGLKILTPKQLIQWLPIALSQVKAGNNNNNNNNKDGENVPHLEITEVVLVCCSIVDNDYQQDSRVLYTFVSNKISWFTDQNGQPLQIEEIINLTLVIK